MVGNINRSQNRFTFDTCVGIKAFKRPNVSSLLACHVNFEGSEIHFTSQSIFEAKRLGFDVDAISKQIQKSTGARIIFGKITEQMCDDASYLESKCPTLHSGDSQILSYVRATKTTLITCDKGLAQAAMLSRVSVINPDTLPCDQIAKNVAPKYSEIISKAIRKPHIVKQKVKKLALRPGQKIVWSSFV